MGQLAVRAVHVRPVLEDGQDRLDLTGQQAVQRDTAGLGVGQPAGLTAAQPPVRPPLRQTQPATGVAQRPVGLEGLVEQREQRRLGGRVDTVRDLAT